MEHKIYGMSIEIDPRCKPDDFVIKPSKFVIPANMEEKVQKIFWSKMATDDWKFQYGVWDDAYNPDPIQDAIDRAVRELR